MFCQDVVTLPQGRLYSVNVLTQQMFPSGQTLKIGKSILLKKNTNNNKKNPPGLYTIHPKRQEQGQELFCVCF